MTRRTFLFARTIVVICRALYTLMVVGVVALLAFQLSVAAWRAIALAAVALLVLIAVVLVYGWADDCVRDLR
jgi:uncharacterized membrane protein